MRTVARTSHLKRWLASHYAHPDAKRRFSDPNIYRSSGAFRLLDIRRQYDLGFDNDRVRTVLDLGAAPGGWSQVTAGLMYKRLSATAREELSHWGLKRGEGWSDTHGATSSEAEDAYEGPMIIAVDKVPMEPINGVRNLQLDFMEPGSLDVIREMIPKHRKVDVILSDMYVDDETDSEADKRMMGMYHKVLAFAKDNLQPIDETSRKRGALVMRWKPSHSAQVFHRVYLQKAFRCAYKVDNSKGEPGRYWVCWGFQPEKLRPLLKERLPMATIIDDACSEAERVLLEKALKQD